MSKGRYKECKDCKDTVKQFYGCADCPIMAETQEERRARRKQDRKRGEKTWKPKK